MKMSAIALCVLLVAVCVVHGRQFKRDDGKLGDVDIIPDEPPLPPVNQTRDERDYVYYGDIDREIIDHKDEGGTGKAGGCTPEYKKLKGSIMCNPAYKDNPDVIEFGISPKDIQLIVNMHNDYREMENAASMAKMYWDESLAVPAQKLAQSCKQNHDKQSSRAVPKYKMFIGQNLCMGYGSWKSCLKALHGEIVDFTPGGPNDVKKVGHYTQMVNQEANLVGCGFAYCSKHKRPTYYVCNYAYGQTGADIKSPYQPGKKCDNCPNHCFDGELCNCGQKVCENGGSIILRTCSCKCVPPFTGDTCKEVACGKKDKKYCKSGGYIPSNCNLKKNVKKKCPRMCGLC